MHCFFLNSVRFVWQDTSYIGSPLVFNDTKYPFEGKAKNSILSPLSLKLFIVFLHIIFKIQEATQIFNSTQVISYVNLKNT
jgi:hypothetical protein